MAQNSARRRPRRPIRPQGRPAREWCPGAYLSLFRFCLATLSDLSLAEGGLWDQQASDLHNAHVSSTRGQFDQAVTVLQTKAREATSSALGEEGVGGMLLVTQPLLPTHSPRQRETPAVWELQPLHVRAL